MSKKRKVTDTRPFAEKHPRWNFFIGLLLFLGMIAGAIAIAYYLIKFISHIVSSFVDWISTVATTLDAVVIVALITGAVSIVGVIISSIVAKSLEYRTSFPLNILDPYLRVFIGLCISHRISSEPC